MWTSQSPEASSSLEGCTGWLGRDTSLMVVGTQRQGRRDRGAVSCDSEMLYWSTTLSAGVNLMSKAYGSEPQLPDKPMISRRDYDKARAILDALSPGYYVKCAGCSGWYADYQSVRGMYPLCLTCTRDSSLSDLHKRQFLETPQGGEIE